MKKANSQKYYRICGKFLSLALTSLVIIGGAQDASAQAIVTIDGQNFESISWVVEPGFVSSVAGTWGENGGGSLVLDAEFYATVETGPTSFTDPIFTTSGVSLADVTYFNPNMGQHNGKEDLPADQQTIENVYTLTATELPTELYYLIGDDGNNGHKYTVHSWSSTQADTVFDLINSTPTIRDVIGNATNDFEYRNYDPSDSDVGNNSAKVLVRVRNPNGISNFSTISNRVDDNTGAIVDTAVGANSADFSPTQILVRVTPPPLVPATPQVPIPTGGLGMLSILTLLLCCIEYWYSRKQRVKKGGSHFKE